MKEIIWLKHVTNEKKNDLAHLIFEALKRSTYGGTKTGEPRPGDHKEE